MKHVDEFRDPQLARELVEEIRSTCTRRWVLMDVCGGQTHSLLRNGIEEVLDGSVELIHGPGCPVCVTPTESIDLAQSVAMTNGVTLATFGDMIRVPGSSRSLQQTRAAGGSVITVYCPSDAVRMARENPDRQVVFFSVGFETTAPATALAVLQAERLGLSNFSLLVSHVRVLPAMEQLMKAEDNRVEGFLAAGHVCTITGWADYVAFSERYRVPVVVTGFEPIDLLAGIRGVVRQLEQRRFCIKNCYGRSVRREGNLAAQRVVDQVFEISNRVWRGFGEIEKGGLRLNNRYRCFDAEVRFATQSVLPIVHESRCRSADVLAGRIKPTQCQAFGTDCHPDRPLGAPMVSSEGACAAYHRYHKGSPRSADAASRRSRSMS